MLSFGLDMSMEACHDILQDSVVKASYLKLLIQFME